MLNHSRALPLKKGLLPYRFFLYGHSSTVGQYQTTIAATTNMKSNVKDSDVDVDVVVIFNVVVVWFFSSLRAHVGYETKDKEKKNSNLHLSKNPHHILDSCISDHPPL